MLDTFQLDKTVECSAFSVLCNKQFNSIFGWIRIAGWVTIMCDSYWKWKTKRALSRVLNPDTTDSYQSHEDQVMLLKRQGGKHQLESDLDSGSRICRSSLVLLSSFKVKMFWKETGLKWNLSAKLAYLQTIRVTSYLNGYKVSLMKDEPRKWGHLCELRTVHWTMIKQGPKLGGIIGRRESRLCTAWSGLFLADARKHEWHCFYGNYFSKQFSTSISKISEYL